MSNYRRPCFFGVGDDLDDTIKCYGCNNSNESEAWRDCEHRKLSPHLAEYRGKKKAEKVEPKFKVGDKVRVTENGANCSGYKKDNILTVDRINSSEFRETVKYVYAFEEVDDDGIGGCVVEEYNLEPVNVCYMKPEGEVCDCVNGKCRYSIEGDPRDYYESCDFGIYYKGLDEEDKEERKKCLSPEDYYAIYPEDKPVEVKSEGVNAIYPCINTDKPVCPWCGEEVDLNNSICHKCNKRYWQSSKTVYSTQKREI